MYIKRGQGPLEYVLLIGGVVLVVVILFSLYFSPTLSETEFIVENNLETFTEEMTINNPSGPFGDLLGDGDDEGDNLSGGDDPCGGPTPPVCGNSIKEGAEICDGADLGGNSCTAMGYDQGLLGCTPTCDGFDTSACSNYTYDYGVYLEPPTGKVMEGMRQWPIDNALYLAKAAGMGGPLPAHQLFYVNVAETDDPADKPMKSADFLLVKLNEISANGMIPQIGVQYYDFSPDNDPYNPNPAVCELDNLCYSATSHDHIVADPTHPLHQGEEDQIRRLGQALAQFDKPVWIKPGFEFNNPDGGYPKAPQKGRQAYHPYEFPKAFIKTREYIEDEYAKAGKTPKVAWLWVWDAAAENDYLDYDALGNPKWYPGDSVVDWWGVDHWGTNDFTNESIYPGFGPPNLIDVEKFLNASNAHGKPVCGETAEIDIDITIEATDTQGIWGKWFEVWINFIAAHPIIKCFNYIDNDWGDGFISYWKDSRRFNNDEITSKWLNEMKNEKYTHQGEFDSLYGYDG
jgi:hypothetical protein